MARPGPPFPRVRGSVRRSILAIGSRHLEPLAASSRDPDFDGDLDDESGEREEVTGELLDVAGVARGSGDFLVPPRHGDVGTSDRPLRDELRALAEGPTGSSEELGEILEPGTSEDTQPHGPGRWRPHRPTPPSTDPRSRPLIESLRRREEDAPPVPDVTTKPGLN
jgi:hypothetical protein